MEEVSLIYFLSPESTNYTLYTLTATRTSIFFENKTHALPFGDFVKTGIFIERIMYFLILS